MNLQHQRIAALSEQLKMASVEAEWASLVQEMAGTKGNFAGFLEQVLAGEFSARDERKRGILLKLATMPAVKALEQFVWRRPVAHPKRRSRNWGTSHSCSVPRTSSCSASAATARPTSLWRGARAVMAGHKVRFIPAADLMLQLAVDFHVKLTRGGCGTNLGLVKRRFRGCVGTRLD